MPVLVTHAETGGEAQVITGGAVYKHSLSQGFLATTVPLIDYNSQRLWVSFLFTEQPMPDASMAVTCRFILRNESKYVLFTYREKEI